MKKTKPQGMSLETFVAEVLCSVVRGVEKAQQDLADSEATINPEGSAQRKALQQAQTPPTFPVIEFEAGVEVTSTGEAGGGFQLSVPYVNLETSGKRTGTTTATNQIRFSVPILLPPGQFIKRSDT
ncbi:MAG: hypothetical protein K9L82_18865 [Chromatiaceae bacterium]|nr:hypothetical protein [Chromatiaceae bacterium]MCF7994150.1 hypothetical protein [Chromatiaceae bacterium]MCF8016103.1 hypothetical protein [Chromatiaceae bacterium]